MERHDNRAELENHYCKIAVWIVLRNTGSLVKAI